MFYNKDELEAPNWLNSSFVKKVIGSNGNNKNVKIHDYKISPATALGDHFASIMFRVNVDYSTNGAPMKEKASIIVKTLPFMEGFKKDMLCQEKVDLFRPEAYMFTEVLVDCQDILNKCGYRERLAAKILYSSLDSPKVLVFEDLKELGYFMLPTNLPDEHEVKIIFSKLAQFHAVTFKMGLDGRADLFFKGTMFEFSFVNKMDCFLTGPQFLAELLESLPGFEVYAKKMRKLTFDILMEKCTATVRQPAPYKVLNHGDFHIRNMMFKKNEFDAFSEVVLVDFQVPHWGSPAYDLVYMLSTLPLKLRNVAIGNYFNVFSDVVVKTGYKGDLPTFVELEKDLKSYNFVELFFVSTLSAFLLMDRSLLHEDFEVEKLMTDVTLRKAAYSTPAFIQHVKEVVPRLLDIDL